jgi:hypothetical protein
MVLRSHNPVDMAWSRAISEWEIVAVVALLAGGAAGIFLDDYSTHNSSILNSLYPS